MRARFQVMLIAAALAVSAGAPVAAQVVTPEPPPGEGTWVEPPKTLPPVARGDRLRNLDFLFGALKVAPDDTSAKAIEGRIWAVWASSRSDTANLLMTRVRTAIEAKNTDLALQLLDGVVKIRPDFVEAWNRRATLHYMNRDFGRALGDIREILRREPRHFGALSGLGMILQEIGDDKQALEVYRRALAVHPRLERIPDVVKTLQEKVEGRDI
ncbi:MAG: tetratricopeptide repeat protein [Pseudolabrys sp.]|nr:tetratricopeptide repeat protein [Pseudolabrys sp.]